MTSGELSGSNGGEGEGGNGAKMPLAVETATVEMTGGAIDSTGSWSIVLAVLASSTSSACFTSSARSGLGMAMRTLSATDAEATSMLTRRGGTDIEAAMEAVAASRSKFSTDPATTKSKRTSCTSMTPGESGGGSGGTRGGAGEGDGRAGGATAHSPVDGHGTPTDANEVVI